MENNENENKDIKVQGSNGDQPGNQVQPDGGDQKKPVVSKKFKQETYTAPSGRQYLMTFPGTQKAMKILSENSDTPQQRHQAFMDNILEGEFDYPYFNNLDDGTTREKLVKVTEEDGTVSEYTVKFKNIQQLDEFAVAATDSEGKPSDYKGNLYVLSNMVMGRDLSFNYFDEHNGLSEITQAALKMTKDLRANSEFMLVMNAVEDFLDRMFR